MIELSSLMWISIIMLALVGVMRGWAREIVATAGIVLALFATWQFGGVFIQPLTQNWTLQQVFYLNVGILMVITLFAYQTPGAAERLSEGRYWSGRRLGLQERLLGLVVGGINGYLIFGSIWYYLDASGYPFAPFIIAPAADSASRAMIDSLPLIFLVQGNLLTVLVVVLFLFVIIAMI